MRSEDRLRLIKAAVEQSDLPVVVTTTDLDHPGPEIICVNDAYSDLTGHSSDELIGATPRIHQGTATDRAVLERLKRNLHAGIMFEGSTWNYRKNGSPFLLEWTVTPLRRSSGAIDYFFSVQRDITEMRPRPFAPIRYLETSLHEIRNDSDPVTGAQTRQSMVRCLQRAIDGSIESGKTTGLIKLQLTRAERLNKVFSLNAIYQLLRAIAERITSVCKPDESIARSHEYTFAITIPAITGKDADEYLDARARALQAAVTESEFVIGDETIQVDVSVGIGRAPVDGRDANDLAVLVDEAAQRVDERQDKPGVHWATREAIEREALQLALERGLRHAVSENEIAVYYQPIVDLTYDRIIGAEALARWLHPPGPSPVGPDQFIPLAESLGLIDRLGRRVFEQACLQLRDWQKQSGNELFFVSVNVSPRQLVDRNLPDRFLALTRAAGVAPACIKLEITESALEQDSDTVKAVITDLMTAGFPLAVDDFGKGHSSLERIITLPFSLLKVDRSFIWQIPDGPGAGVVEGLVKLAEHLKLCALGEGVETAVHNTFLKECGYTYAQGYYYGKPAAPKDCSFRLDAVENSSEQGGD